MAANIEKIEILFNSELLDKIRRFCEFIHWPIDKFIQKELGDILELYQEALKDNTGVLERIYYDFFEEPFIKKLSKVFSGDLPR